MTPLAFAVRLIVDRDHDWRWKARWAAAACAKAAAILLGLLCLAWGYAAFVR